MAEKYRGLSDLALVDLMKSGDELAFAEIYERFWGILLAQAFRMLKDEDIAKDVIQDVFLGLWDNVPTVQIASLGAYMNRLVTNRVLNELTRNRIRTDHLASITKFQEQRPAMADDGFLERELAARVEKGLAAMPYRMREVYELSRHQHLSHEEISRQLNISPNTVKRQLNKVLNRLREYLSFLIL